MSNNNTKNKRIALPAELSASVNEYLKGSDKTAKRAVKTVVRFAWDFLQKFPNLESEAKDYLTNSAIYLSQNGQTERDKQFGAFMVDLINLCIKYKEVRNNG